MASTTITKLSKNKILKARAGIKALPAVTQMAFGNGADGTPSEDDNTLKNETVTEGPEQHRAGDGHQLPVYLYLIQGGTGQHGHQ